MSSKADLLSGTVTYEADSDDSSSLNHKSMSMTMRRPTWTGMRRNKYDNLRSRSLIKRVKTFSSSGIMDMPKELRRQLRKRLREDLAIVILLSSKLEAKAHRLRRHSRTYPTLSDAQFSGNDVKSGGYKEVTSNLFPATSKTRNVKSFTKKKAVPVDGWVLSKESQGFLSHCQVVLKRLMCHKDGWVFNEPVDAVKLGLSDYHSIIKHPMDLGTIKVKLDKKAYDSPEQFATDVRLTFDNAMAYNPAGNDVHVMANQLKKLFEQLWESVCRHLRTTNAHSFLACCALSESNDGTLSKMVVDIMKSKAMAKAKVPVKSKTLSEPKVSVNANFVAKAQSLPDMSYEEKAQLIGSLQQLPTHVQDLIIRLMKERNPNLSQKEDEIEVDIDSFNNETLWELDQYVKTHLNASKNYKEAAGEESQAMETSALPTSSKEKNGDQQQQDCNVDVGKRSETNIVECAISSKNSAHEKQPDIPVTGSESSSMGSESGNSNTSGSGATIDL